MTNVARTRHKGWKTENRWEGTKRWPSKPNGRGCVTKHLLPEDIRCVYALLFTNTHTHTFSWHCRTATACKHRSSEAFRRYDSKSSSSLVAVELFNGTFYCTAAFQVWFSVFIGKSEVRVTFLFQWVRTHNACSQMTVDKCDERLNEIQIWFIYIEENLPTLSWLIYILSLQEMFWFNEDHLSKRVSRTVE